MEHIKSSNPFIKNFPLNVIKRISKSNNIIDFGNEPGVSVTQKIEYNTTWFEQQSSCKLYRLPYMDNILFKNCSSAGRDLLLYIQIHLKDNFDYIELKFKKVHKAMDIKSMKTFYGAIQSLTDVGIICKKGANEYWINPYYIFKGDRITYYRNNAPEGINVVYCQDMIGNKLPKTAEKEPILE